MRASIDLNCDLGETLDGAIDAAVMPYISSCNVACGGHAGDRQTMARIPPTPIANTSVAGLKTCY